MEAAHEKNPLGQRFWTLLCVAIVPNNREKRLDFSEDLNGVVAWMNVTLDVDTSSGRLLIRIAVAQWTGGSGNDPRVRVPNICDKRLDFSEDLNGVVAWMNVPLDVDTSSGKLLIRVEVAPCAWIGGSGNDPRVRVVPHLFAPARRLDDHSRLPGG